MRILFLLCLFVFSCDNNSEPTICEPQSQLSETLIVGYFILEDDFLFSSLDGPQELKGENLEIGYSYGDGIFWIESDTYDFSSWRNIRIATPKISFSENYGLQNYSANHTEVQLTSEFNEWIYENQDAHIFFHLNFDL